MNHNHIALFLDVVEQGSINGAARLRNVAQSAVSRIVRELELSQGVPLLRRQHWGVEPTDAGQILADLARSVRAEAKVAEQSLAALKKGEKVARLRIGTGRTTAAAILPMALDHFVRTDARCRIEVRMGHFDTLLPALARGDLDIVLGRIGNSSLAEGLVEELLYHDSMVILAGARHPLARKKTVSNAELLAARWILPHHDAEPWKDTEMMFHSFGMPVPIAAIESDSAEFIRALLHSRGQWLAVMPRDLFELDLATRKVAIVREAPKALVRAVGLVRRRGGYGIAKHPLESFLRILAAVVAKHPVQTGRPPVKTTLVR
jgi:DNA-binding transcriptional LysR family regulator